MKHFVILRLSGQLWLVLAMVLLGVVGGSLSAADRVPLKIAQGVDGFPWGTAREVIVKKKPDIYAHMQVKDTIIDMYLNDVALCYDHGKLIGAEFRAIVGSEIRHEWDDHPDFVLFRSEDGINDNMRFDEVQRRVGVPLVENNDQIPIYSANLGPVTLSCVFIYSEKVAPENHVLNEMWVRVNRSP